MHLRDLTALPVGLMLFFSFLFQPVYADPRMVHFAVTGGSHVADELKIAVECHAVGTDDVRNSCAAPGMRPAERDFSAPATARISFASSGYAGIGTATPAAKLDVYTSAGIGAIDLGGVNGISYPSGDSTAGASIAIGPSALSTETAAGSAAYKNTAIGYQAMGTGTLTTAALNNTAVGYQTLKANTSGSNNSGVGVYALTANTTGIGNAALGYAALYSNSGGQNNTGIGLSAAYSNITGSGNTAVGENALYNNTTGSSITAIGATAGGNITGNNNTVIGFGVAGNTLTTGVSNILIGTSTAVDTPAAGSSNFLNIGNVIFATGMTGTVASPAGSVGIGFSNPDCGSV